MKIGIVCGEPYHLTRNGQHTSPDWMTQGLLVRKLLDAGHQVVLFTRTVQADGISPTLDEMDDPRFSDRFEIRLTFDPTIDLLLTDKMRRDAGYSFSVALDIVMGAVKARIPCLHHQTVAYPGFAPPFAAMPELLRTRWTIMNRCEDPPHLWDRSVGRYEGRYHDHNVKWRKWEPFWQLDPAFATSSQDNNLVEPANKEFVLGYIGRLKMSESRTTDLARAFNSYSGSKAVVGTNNKAFAESTGSTNLGPCTIFEVNETLRTFWSTVQAPFDRLVGLDSWPNRFIEAAIAGVYQFFLPGFKLPEELKQFVVHEPELGPRINDMIGVKTNAFYSGLNVQRKTILARANPDKVTSNLLTIIEEAAE